MKEHPKQPVGSQIKTIFVYDKDNQQRRKILNYFTLKGGFRVLCLDFLVQTKKKADEIKPDAILCCPHGDHINLLKTITVMRRDHFSKTIPFYIYWEPLSEHQKQVYVDNGIRNIFDQSAILDDIYRGVKSGASFSKFVAKSDIIMEEGAFYSGAEYFKVKLIAAGVMDLKILLRQLSQVNFKVDWSDVVLDMTLAGEVDQDCVVLILNFFKEAVNNGIDVNTVGANAQFKKFVNFPTLSHFDDFQGFLAKSGSSSAMNSNVDLSDLDSLPDFDDIDNIEDIDDLDSLLDSIPD